MQNSLRMKYSRHHYHLFHLPANKIAIQASNWRIIKINNHRTFMKRNSFPCKVKHYFRSIFFQKNPIFSFPLWMASLTISITKRNFVGEFFFFSFLFSLFAKDLELVLAKFLPRQSKGVFVRSSLHAKTATNLEGS